jgi:hypothetical protein
MAGMTSSTRPPRTRTRAATGTAARTSAQAAGAKSSAAARWRPDPTWLVVIRSVTTGGFIAVLSLALWLIVTLAAWVLSPHGSTSPADPMRLGVGLFAWSNHAGMTVNDVPVALTPLGLMVVPFLLCWAGAHHLVRLSPPPDLPAVARMAGMFAAGYAAVATIAVIPTGGDLAAVAPPRMLVWSVVVSFLCCAFGLIRGAHLTGPLVDLVPVRLRPVLTAGTVAALAMVAAAALITAVALAAALPESADLSARLHAGVLGGFLVTLLGLAFVPNLVVWVVAVLVGPGFSVGAATEVSPRLVEYGPLPAFPPVAALPPEGVVPPVGWLVLLVPLLAGVLAGLLVARRVSADTPHVAGWAALSGLVTGAWLGTLAWLSAGGMGLSRLTVIGPAAGRVGLVVALEVGLVAAVTGWEAHRRGFGVDPRLAVPNDGPAVPNDETAVPNDGPAVPTNEGEVAASEAESPGWRERFAWRNVWPHR